ncbi:MAG: simple sugar transport system substrate-binding protein [Gaiellales bacterium]|nr:simple sugar transport system substrate-binding protein [Gaiellales bacterium]
MSAGFDRACLLRRAGMPLATAAALAGTTAEAGAAVPTQALREHPRWRFVFINHATTNPFFVPARYGIEDAAAFFAVDFVWAGSKRSDVGEMVAAMRSAVNGGADGIAVSVIDPVAFNSLTDAALEKGIPVVSYNADGGRDNRRQAYIGQDLYQSGLKFGSRIVELVGEGDVLLYIATPGQLNIQPRVDGALDAVRDSGRPIRMHVVATGADVVAERRKVEQTYRALRRVRGMFAVDGGSTQAVAEVMRAHDLHRTGVRAGGYDLLPGTLESIAAGRLDFTIDQQPYLQGLLPIQQLFLFRYSGGLVSPADTNTGLKFVTRRNVGPYLTTNSRYEGSSGKRKYPVTS